MGSDSKQPVVYNAFLTKRCEKRYKKLQPSDRMKIDAVIAQIRTNPRLGYALKDPILKDLYSIHACENKFRIVYKFTDNPAEVEIWAVELRKHVYEELTRYRSTVKQLVGAEVTN